MTEKRDQDSKPKNSMKIQYKVNGEKQTTTNTTLTVEQILRTAGKAASIDQKQLNKYILEHVRTGKKYENPNEAVEILNDDEFLAVYSGATPVALLPIP